MLPSRTTLKSWNPDALSGSASSIRESGTAVASAVMGIDAACQRMPEARAWSGRSHAAAAAMFQRANISATRLAGYANRVSDALANGAAKIGAARSALLSKADQVDNGELNVTDQWVVLIEPVRMPAAKFAQLQELAAQEQAAINTLLGALGDADDAAANALVAAGHEFGFVEPGPMTSDPGSLLVPPPQRPCDQVPNPHTTVGLLGQEAIRAGDQSVSIREVTESVNKHGEEVTTVTMQDGSRQVVTKRNWFDFPTKQNFITVEQFDKKGNEVSESSSWHDLGSNCDYTSVTWPDGSNLTMSMDPTGQRSAGFTTPSAGISRFPLSSSITSRSTPAGRFRALKSTSCMVVGSRC